MSGVMTGRGSNETGTIEPKGNDLGWGGLCEDIGLWDLGTGHVKAQERGVGNLTINPFETKPTTPNIQVKYHSLSLCGSQYLL